MTRRTAARLLAGIVLALGMATCLASAQKPQTTKPPLTDAQKRQKALASLGAPWPDTATLGKRRVEAENRRLFRSADPIAFTLRADFKAITRDRDPESTIEHPATLVIAGESDRDESIPVRIRTRGALRLRVTTCNFPPIKIEFPKSGLKGTPLAGQESLKLVPHCIDNSTYEQYILKEYLAYRMYGLFTPYSFRARLAKATYVDAVSGKPTTSRYAFFVENDEDVARRMEGRVAEVMGQRFAGEDDDTLVLMTLLQWMFGNTDYSIANLHNVKLVQRQDGMRYPVAYDFDSTGLVDPLYAAPDKRLGIETVRDRLFRGPCRPMERYEVFLQKFREKRAELTALIDAVPGLVEGSRKGVRSFMNEFYTTINSPGRAKKALLDACLKSTRM